MEIFITIIIIFILILLRKNVSINHRIDNLEAKLNSMETAMKWLPKPAAKEKAEPGPVVVPPQPAVKPVIEPSIKPEIKETLLKKEAAPKPDIAAKIEPVSQLKTPISVSRERVTTRDLMVTKPREKKPSMAKEFWGKLEKQFIENWTGILGSVIMVIGVGFLSIYAALKVTPFWRFALITAISLVLFVIYLVLNSREKWLKLATWLRSSAGAIFLFGCLGAGGIAGLKWIHSPVKALALLCFGLAVNLYFGYAGKTQVFASLHVILSLAALAVAPPAAVTLYIAAIVSFVGVLLTLRAKWEYHLLTTVTAFLSYHLFWYVSMGLGDRSKITLLIKLSGIGVTALIGITAACIHYRRLYQSKEFEGFPFTVHLFNWFYMAIGFLLYSTGSKWNTIALSIAAIAAFSLSRRAKSLKIRWLFITDTLISQAIALLAIYTLTRWDVDMITVLGCAWLQTLIFLIIMLREEDSFLRKAGFFLQHLLTLGIILVPLFLLDYGNHSLLTRHAIILTVELAILTLFHSYLVRKHGEALDSVDQRQVKSGSGISFNGILIGLLAISAFLHVYRFSWSGYTLALTGVGLLWIRNRYQMNGLGIGLIILLAGVHLLAWIRLTALQFISLKEVFVYGLPFFIFSYTAAKTSNLQALKRNLNSIAVYIFNLHYFLFIYFLFGRFVMESVGSKWNTLGLSAAAVIAFFWGRWAKSLRIHWLYITDVFLAEAIAIIALCTLSHWNQDILIIMGSIWIESAVFLMVMVHEKDPILKKAGVFIHQLAGLLLVAIPIFRFADTPSGSLIRTALIVAIELLLLSLFHLFLFKRHTESLDSLPKWRNESSPELSFNGILVGLLALAGFMQIYQFLWSGYAVVAVIVALLILRAHYQLNGLGIGTIILTAGSHLVAWRHLSSMPPDSMQEIFVYGLPFLALLYVALKTAYVKVLKRCFTSLPIYLFSLHILICSYFLFNRLYPFIPGTFWLILSVIYLEVSLFLSRKYGTIEPREANTAGACIKHFRLWAYLFLPLFLIRHLLVHIQSEYYLAGFKARFLVEIFAALVLVYWASAQKPEPEKAKYPGKFLQPMMWEIFLAFFLFIVFLESTYQWMPMIWIMTSFVLMGLGYLPKLEVPRFRFYSLLFYWAAAFQIAFISSSLPTPSLYFLEQAWVKGLIGVVMLYVYIIFFYKKSPLENLTFPSPIQGTIQWIKGIRNKKNRWIYYPYFLCLALFLYWTFNSSLLTLLWVVEAFFIFVLSVILKENQFRYVSLLGLGGCLVRLIFYDLGRSSTLTRALVFLGVGILMIAMNSLYNKFRDRF